MPPTVRARGNLRGPNGKERGISNGRNHATGGAPTSQPMDIGTLQQLLNIFRAAFKPELDEDQSRAYVQPLIQEVKHHLFERDFTAAFSRPELLRAYAVRWSASRALAYLRIFHDTFRFSLHSSLQHSGPFVVTCLGGGGGAEVVALSRISEATRRSCSVESVSSEDVQVHVFDQADWSPLLMDLDRTIAIRAPASGEEDVKFSIASHTVNLLGEHVIDSFPTFQEAISTSNLVTLMFTLNEMYSTSMSKTQKFLLDLGRMMPHGSMLLVVDSPGSYSTVHLGNSQGQRNYPMAWLLDHALLNTAAKLASGQESSHADGPWEKLRDIESEWFRLPEGLDYPLSLENMRYQLHLFRRR